jgi:hypothetical protein
MKPGDLVQLMEPADLEEHWGKYGIVLEIMDARLSYPVTVLIDGETGHFEMRELEVIE